MQVTNTSGYGQLQKKLAKYQLELMSSFYQIFQKYVDEITSSL
jgi:hypothetical protein